MCQIMNAESDKQSDRKSDASISLEFHVAQPPKHQTHMHFQEG